MNLKNSDYSNMLFALADQRVNNNMEAFIDTCSHYIAQMEQRDINTIFHSFDVLLGESESVRLKAAQLIGQNNNTTNATSRRIFRAKKYALEGKKEYTILVDFDGLNEGKAVLTGLVRGKNYRYTFNNANGIHNSHIGTDNTGRNTLIILR